MNEPLKPNEKPAIELDTRGLRCPEPVMLLHNAVRDLLAGQVVRVLASDPSTQRDIPKFCLFLGHQLLEHGMIEQNYVYWIQKGQAQGPAITD